MGSDPQQDKDAFEEEQLWSFAAVVDRAQFA